MTSRRPWWSKPLAVVIITFGLTVPAGCANPPDDDRPGHVDTSTENRCDLDGTLPAVCEDQP